MEVKFLQKVYFHAQIEESQKVETDDGYSQDKSTNEEPNWLVEDTPKTNSSKQNNKKDNYNLNKKNPSKDFENSNKKNLPKKQDNLKKNNFFDSGKSTKQNKPKKNIQNISCSQKTSSSEGKAPPLPNIKEKDEVSKLYPDIEEEKEISYLNSKIKESDFLKYKCIEKKGDIKIYLY